MTPSQTVFVQGGTVLAPTGPRAADVLIIGGRIVDLVRPGDVSAARGPSTAEVVIDATGLVVAPGFVDLQCNGAAGIDLTASPERLWEIAAALPRWGVTSWLPTIVTSAAATTERALAVLARRPATDEADEADEAHGPDSPDGPVHDITRASVAQPLGLHLEGPFLAPGRRGAHPVELLVPPSAARAASWSVAAGVRMVTIAPELPGALDLIRQLVARGVVVSLGHSEANADQVDLAIEAGASFVTHLFNAMPPLHHRDPGLVGAALLDDRLHVGLIADGIHVDPRIVALAHRTLGARLVLVTDSTAALGSTKAEVHLGHQITTTDDTGVRLSDGTLAGSALALDQAVRNLMAFTGCSLVDAVDAASTGPAAAIGATTKGRIAAGADADLVVLQPDGELVLTIIGGRLAHDARKEVSWRS